MPHLIVEYSMNVDERAGGPVSIPALLATLHSTALDTGIAALDALRTRGEPRADYVIADGHVDNMFIAVTIRLGAGRGAADVDRVVADLTRALDGHLGAAQETMMLSVEAQEIDPRRRINKNNLRPVIAARRANPPHHPPPNPPHDTE